MKSVGETMAIGRTFKESFQKALRGLEVGSFGFGCDGKDLWGTDRSSRTRTRSAPSWRLQCRPRLVPAIRAEERDVASRRFIELTDIDPWFLDQLAEIVEMEDALRGIRRCASTSTPPRFRQAKQFGFSDRQLATIWGSSEMDVRE